MTALTSVEEYWAEETLTGQGQNGTQALSNTAPSAPSTPTPTPTPSAPKVLDFFAIVGNVFIFLMIIEVILLLLILYEVMKRWPVLPHIKSTS